MPFCTETQPRRFFQRLTLCALSAIVALSGCSTMPPLSEPVARGDQAAVTQQLQAFIAQQVRAHQVAGLSIALVDDQRLLWTHSVGWADIAAQRPAGPDTLYRMGSVSKLFTDVAALQLVAQGRLSLDVSVQQALPGFRIGTRPGDGDKDGPITVRQLMTHHAGLPRDVLGGMWGMPAGDFRAMVRSLPQEQTVLPPGRMYAYSNVALNVLGATVEQVSGQPFETRMQQAVLDPLGMRGSSFSADLPASPQMARAYSKSALQDEPGLRDVPAGGLTASVSDVARFASMVFAQGRNAQGESVLPAPWVAEMLRPQNEGVPLDAGFRVGLGWMLSEFGQNSVHGGGPVAHHSGATFYFRSRLMLLPEHRLGVVVAANDSAAGEVVNRVAQRALALMLEAKTGVRQPERTQGYRTAATPWPEAARQACVGEYLTPMGVVSIEPHGEGLRAQTRGMALEVIEGEDRWIGLRYRLGGLIPISLGALSEMGVQCRVVDGRAVLVARLNTQEMTLGDRLPAPSPLPPSAAGLVGRYEPVLAPGEQPTVEAIELKVEGGRLWALARVHPAFGGQTTPPLPLPVLSDDEALLLGPWGDRGAPVRRLLGPDGQVQFTASGWTFRRVSR